MNNIQTIFWFIWSVNNINSLVVMNQRIILHNLIVIININKYIILDVPKEVLKGYKYEIAGTNDTGL